MSEEITAVKAPKRSKRMIILLLVSLVLFGCLGVAYYQLSLVNLSLARDVRELEASSNHQNDALVTLSATVNALKEQADQASTDTTSDASAFSDMKARAQSDMNRWTVAEAQYLVNLANDHLQFTHNMGMALILLQRAQQVLSPLTDENLSTLKQSLADNIASLTAAPTTDLSGLYTQLTTLNADMNRLPLPTTPLKNEETTEADKVNVAGLPWWKAEWRRTMFTLSKVVIVRYNGASTPPLILPEERVFINQNLHAQMENVFWAILNRDAGVYQSAILRMHDWIAEYYDTTSPLTQAMLQQLQALSAQPIAGPSVNVAATQQAFKNYFDQAATIKSAQ